jgi:uncharacterized protein (TIGR02266 family)
MEDDGNFKHPRRHKRLPLSILVQFRYHPYEDFLYEYTMDVSPGGVFLRTETPQPVGATVYLQFSPRDGSVLIEGVGRIARVVPPGKGMVPGIGVEFTQMDERTKERIRELCESQGKSLPR